MATFAQWLRNQTNNDPDLQELKAFASTDAANWPWWSENRAEYEARVQTEPDPATQLRLMRALATYFERWSNTARTTQTLSTVQKVGGTLLGVFGAIFFIFLFWGLFFQPTFFTSLAGVEQARGFITFLFAFAVIAVIILIAVTIFWLDIGQELDDKFSKAKDLLTIIIGVFGTILGFYYGSLIGGESRLAVTNVELSKPVPSAGDTVKISATIFGGTAPYTYEIQFSDPTGEAQEASKLTIKSKKADSTGIITESVTVPANVKQPTSLTFTIIASDAKGAQARATGTMVIVPKPG